MIRRVPDIACDMCHVWEGDFSGGTDRDIRAQARKRGWRRTKTLGIRVDVCPNCVLQLPNPAKQPRSRKVAPQDRMVYRKALIRLAHVPDTLRPQDLILALSVPGALADYYIQTAIRLGLVTKIGTGLYQKVASTN